MPTLRGLFSLAGKASAVALLLGAASGCGPVKPCDGVSGSCLVITVDGVGPYDAMSGALLGAGGAEIRSGVLASQPMSFPTKVRMVPPDGVSSGNVKSVRLNGLRNGQTVATGTTMAGFSWPDGAQIETTIQLTGVDPPPPGPLLVWRQETAPATAMSQLYDVWATSMGSGGDFVIAVGDGGTTLVKSGSQWVSESSGTNALLGGVFGETNGTLIASGQAPSLGAYKRDGMAPNAWTKESGGLMPGGKGLWSMAAGTAPGEYWAGDDDGKVWHRTVSGMAMTVTWTSEQALPVGIGVYGIAQAGGAVFAVGDSGNVGYRRDSQAGTTWTTSKIANIASGDWLNGVWAFDASTAFAVGRQGYMVRFQGTSWATMATKIDTNNTELFGVWGMNPSKLWVVGASGLILRVDTAGTTSTTYKLFSMQGRDLQAVFGLSETNLYAVGGAAGQPSFILHGTL